MQLQLVYNKDGDQELMLIELHGSIENTNEDRLDGHLMGYLQWLNDKDALLVIGSSIIRGKVTELEMPMLLTRPLKKSSQDEDGEIEVPHIVTKKIVFRTKPYDFVDNILPKLLPNQENIETQYLEN